LEKCGAGILADGSETIESKMLQPHFQWEQDETTALIKIN